MKRNNKIELNPKDGELVNSKIYLSSLNNKFYIEAVNIQYRRYNIEAKYKYCRDYK